MTRVGEVNDRRKDTRRRGVWMVCGEVAGCGLSTGSTAVIFTLNIEEALVRWQCSEGRSRNASGAERV
jgi:hypothetical protein